MALMILEYWTALATGPLPVFTPMTGTPYCLKCGSTQNIVGHHPYGKKQVPEILVPLCRTCHTGHGGIHTALTQAKVDLRYTSDKIERGRRAKRALCVFLWWLEEKPEVSGNRREIQ